VLYNVQNVLDIGQKKNVILHAGISVNGGPELCSHFTRIQPSIGTTWKRCKTFIQPGSNLDFNGFQLPSFVLTGRRPQLLSAQAALRVVIILNTSACQDGIISKNSSDFQYTRHAKIAHFSASVLLKA
jgi:hypothetical protein